jgi:hypothetical protein
VAHLGAAELDRCLLDAQERTSRSEGDTSENCHTGLSTGVIRALFDHLICAQQQRCRQCETKRIGGLAIDDKFDFGRLLDGKF